MDRSSEAVAAQLNRLEAKLDLVIKLLYSKH